MDNQGAEPATYNQGFRFEVRLLCTKYGLGDEVFEKMVRAPVVPHRRATDYKPEFVEQAKFLCERYGATDEELCLFFDVNNKTLRTWFVKHPEFSAAIVDGKGVSDERVKRSLYQRAVGMYIDTEKIFMPAGASKPVRAKTREYIPPDTAACMHWLKNRDRENWRDKQDVHHSGGVSGSGGSSLNSVPAELTARDLKYLAILF